MATPTKEQIQMRYADLVVQYERLIDKKRDRGLTEEERDLASQIEKSFDEDEVAFFADTLKKRMQTTERISLFSAVEKRIHELGGTVVAMRRKDFLPEGSEPEVVVLWHNADSPTPWITHRGGLEHRGGKVIDGRDASVFWGHYHVDRAEAEKDYATRG